VTSELPAPLVPPDVDLRGLPFMPLDTVRLLDSDLFALSTGDEFKAALALWCKAWQQVPASSLPDDDRVLAHLSGAGTRWKRIKAAAMRAFVLCSDGRWYHPVIAEKALDAWSHRIAQRDRAAKRWHPSGNATASDPAMPRHVPRHPSGNASEVKRSDSEVINRDSGVDVPSVAQPTAGEAKVNGAVEKIGRSKAKTEGAGQQWDKPEYVAATAQTVGKPRRENEAFDEWRDRVYTAAQQLRREARP
jgi:hypothetical protein